MEAPSEASKDEDDDGAELAIEAPPEASTDEDDDEQSVAQAQERLLQALMARAGRELPRTELERNWAILGELGHGTYGRVLLAEPRRGGARVALKLLSKERTARWGFLREFCTHLCLRGALTCIQVLPLAFETPTEFGFAQEFAPAGDLCSLLTPGVGLPEPQVKRCAAQVSAALSYLHGHALVHRDLKLDNVLAFDAECHLVKLGDFGLTRVQGWQVRPAPGPTPYAAPELWHLRAGEARPLHLEPALDTWAFGVLLFALLTGAFPWASPARSDPAFRRFHAWHGRTCAAPPPRTWRGLGEAALGLLRGLLHPRPSRRCPPGEVLRYLGRPWAGERGQVSAAGEGGSGEGSPSGEEECGQVSSAGEEECGQVSSAGEEGQVSSAGEEECGQVISADEEECGQVSSAGEAGQVSSAGEGGSGQGSSSGQNSQMSPAGEEECGQVSSAGEEEQVSSAGEEEQVSSAGEEECGQVSSAGEGGSGQGSSSCQNGQVSPAGEEGQVSPTGESSQGSPAGEESDQVSSAGEERGQVSPAGEEGQVSPASDSGSSGSEVGTPGQVRETSRGWIETPGDGLGTPGQVRETPGHGMEIPGVRWKHLEMG